jgi:S-adenosylmethionine:tRNA ribosyltransferase-isomerase
VLPTNALDYHLPGELIATQPPLQREDARLLVCHTTSGQRAHKTVRELPEVLRPNDLLIMNRSRVMPARLNGVRTDTAGKVQMLYLRGRGTQWEALVRARRLKPGMPVEIRSPAGAGVGTVELLHRINEQGPEAETGAWSVRSTVPVETLLELAGLPPLPPYILAARQLKGENKEQLDDLERYQTVYAAEPGSVAAPTAGLHLTQPLLEALRTGGVRTAEVVLHVGTGTFKPVEADHLEQHPMHTESCSVPSEVIEAIHHCRASGGRVIAVGTTTARALESYAALDSVGVSSHGVNPPLPDSLETNILISPGHHWRWVDGLLTNFHLPRSTLLAMVASLIAPDRTGVDLLLGVYEEAIAYRYRFYSYGDAMLVLP